MLFHTLNFAFFLPVVFTLYWCVFNNDLKKQNLFLLLASYFFYSCWDYRFLFLLLFSTFLDYFSGLKIFNSKSLKSRRFWFWLSVIINLGFLAYFKYCNFFIESFINAFPFLRHETGINTLNIILPVGISFYTFHGLSYVIDVYNKKIEPVTDFVDYSLFVSFFPLLVAGPIERATHLLPQIQKKRHFDYSKATDGLRQILWGLFKKVVVADTCAVYANMAFNDIEGSSGSTLMLGAICFAFQIYCDFSGYSDIALGVAKLLGIDLLRNFAFPYFSRDIAEFWRRWHISLSSWFRDYLYFPLGGSRGNTLRKVRNIFVIFLVSGFWHGASWNFVFWGALNAVYFLPLLLLSKNRDNIEIVAKGRIFPSVRDFWKMSLTFFLTVMAWIFFRAKDMSDAFLIISKIFSPSIFSLPEIIPKTALMIIALLLIIDWQGRENEFPLQKMGRLWNRYARWGVYCCLLMAIYLYSGKEEEFIYFQF